MKPREFDELIRQKFDQNDFEYSPANWERLADRMDGRTKRRTMMMWWWVPAMGVAASVALAIGVSHMWRYAETGNAGVAGFIRNVRVERTQPVQDNTAQYIAATPESGRHKKNHTIVAAAQPQEEQFGIILENAITNRTIKTEPKIKFDFNSEADKKKEQKKEVAMVQAVATFKPGDDKKGPKLSIFLGGGVNHGSQNSGYAGGATIRRMVSDKVYVEGDLAFVSSNNTDQRNDVEWKQEFSNSSGSFAKASAVVAGNYNNSPSGGGTVAGQTDGRSHALAKTSQTTTVGTAPTYRLVPVPKPVTDNYNMSYAEVAPAIGVQLIKKLSVAAGADFQQALSDNRPNVTASQTFENVAVMPLFDIGLVGKTEYSVTKRLKAQVSYRKGINNVLTPMDKYTDRDYLQVQVRCAIFNK